MTDRQLEKTFKLYLSITKGLKQRTVKSYLSDWRRFWRWFKAQLSNQPTPNRLRHKLRLTRKKINLDQADLIVSQISPSIIRATNKNF